MQELELGMDREDEETIGLREFARLIDVKLASVQDAMEGRLAEAVVQVRHGKRLERKLRKKLALELWNETRTAGNNNRSGELDADKVEGDERPAGAEKTYWEAKVAQEKFLALEQDRLEREGKLHNAEDIKPIWTAQCAALKSRVLGLPGSLASEIAALGGDVPKIKKLLKTRLSSALNVLKDYDAKEIARHRKQRMRE